MIQLICYMATVCLCIFAVRSHDYTLAIMWGAAALGFLRDNIVAEIKKAVATPRGGE